MTLAVHSLEHFALGVPDAEVGKAFYEDFGLTATPDGNALRLDAGNGAAAFLCEAQRKRLHHLTFAIDAPDFAELKTRLEAGGVKLLDPPKELGGEGLWFRDPDENVICVTAGTRRAPTTRSTVEWRTVGPGERAAPEKSCASKPRRLGHCLLFTPDVARALAFYERFLGLRLSDRSGDIVAFMHTPHGSDHHIIAFGHSERPGFHHASFEVPSVDQIGINAMHMAEKGYREGWGFGRHYIGSNFFHYVRDPWSSFAEYFCDIDFIPAECAWEARDVPSEFALFVWGPPPPPYFFQNFEEG